MFLIPNQNVNERVENWIVMSWNEQKTKESLLIHFYSQNLWVINKSGKWQCNSPKPNSCSNGIPINSRLKTLTKRWKTPTCNQMQVKIRHSWSEDNPPIFNNLMQEISRENIIIRALHIQKNERIKWNNICE